MSVPVNKNTKDGCVPISSRCVIWQGPNLPCINLCKGDSVDDVIYKLAKLLCESTAGIIDVSSIKFKCLVDELSDEPETLLQVIQLLIDKVCTLDSICQGLSSGGSGGSGEVIIRLPECLHYTNGNGDFIDQLPHVAHNQLLATKICSILSSIASINASISTMQAAITTIQNQIAAGVLNNSPIMVNPTCTGDAKTAIPIAVAYQQLEADYCEIKAVLGLSTALIQAAATQCAGLASEQQLCGEGLMSQIPGWILNPATIADTITNLWLTVCDMRCQLAGLTDQVATDCSDFLLNFSPVLNVERTEVNFKLAGYTVIPNGFTPGCTPNGSASIKISNGTLEHVHTFNFDEQLSNYLGMNVNLAAIGFATTDTFTFTLEACVERGKTVCAKTNIKQLLPNGVCKKSTLSLNHDWLPGTTSSSWRLGSNGCVTDCEDRSGLRINGQWVNSTIGVINSGCDNQFAMTLSLSQRDLNKRISLYRGGQLLIQLDSNDYSQEENVTVVASNAGENVGFFTVRYESTAPPGGAE